MKLTTTLMGILSVFSTAFAQFPGCPSIDAGADQTLTCNQPCATLNAIPFHAGATTTYTVASIPHTPPIAYNQAGGTAVSVGTDDVWSPVVNLPFNFCFYGSSYTSCTIGSNGSIKFGGGNAGAYQSWSFSASLPNTALAPVGDIFGIYHDIDPTVAGSVKYYLIGTAPCRILCVVYNDLGHFSCTSLRSTFMMVLYETTNVIDVYVQQKELCSSWNSGNAIIGIQNPAGTSGIAAPNRNTSPTWTVSTPEGWRFTPNGAPIYTTEWFQGGTSLGTGNTVNVCPTATTTYTAQVTYTACDGTVIVKTDNMVVSPDPSTPSGNEIASTPSSCVGSTGSFEVQGTGGAGGYQYSIDNGVTWQVSGVFNSLAAGNYPVLVQDANGCQGSVAATVGQPSTIDLTLASSTNVSCNGGSNGSAVTAISGGQFPYSYTLNGGSTQSTGTYSNLAAGSYTIQVTDANGCSDTQPVTITEPALLSGSFVSSAPASCTSANGSLDVSANGGSGAASFSIDNGSTTQPTGSFVNVAGGSYSILVSDANGCTITIPAIVNTVNNLTAILVDNSDVTCNGLQNGQVTLGGAGTPGPYTYSVTGSNNFQPTNFFTNLSAGIHSYVVMDVSGCTDTLQVTIAEPTVISMTTNTPLTMCNGSSVIMNAQATGGNGGYVFSWSNSLPNGSTNTVSPSTTTNYTVTATDVNGCTASSIIHVTVNPNPPINAGTDQMVCIGNPVVLSGSGVQSYNWNNGVTNGVSFTPASTQTYTVTGTDANGCQGSDQVVVTVNPLPTVDAGVAQTVCQGTSVTLNGSGAVSYTWNNGVTNGVSFIINSTQTYTVTGTNANGCTNTDQVTITVNQPIPVNAGIDQSVCQGGAVTLTATGTQTYSWNNGVTNGIAFTPASTQTYTVTGTDANGCQSTDQVVVTINPLPNVNAGADQSICIGGSVTLSGSGAQTYVWNNGVTNGILFTPGATQTYTVTGTDINGCVNTDQITVTIVQFPIANVSADVTSGFPILTVNLDNNSTNASTYQWSFGDGFQLNASTTAGQQHGYVNPGEYIVVLTASNGSCSDTDTLLITVNPLPDPIVVIPNIFTPNGDNNNDTFFITVSYVKSVKVTIVNRWGDKMSDYDGVQAYWDGTVNGNIASDGVYFFTYEIEGINGKILTGQGDIQLIRN